MTQTQNQLCTICQDNIEKRFTYLSCNNNNNNNCDLYSA